MQTNNKFSFLQKIYLVILFFLFVIIVLTPFLIKDGISFFEEEFLESLLILILSIIGYMIIFLYRKEAKKTINNLLELEKEKDSMQVKLNNAFKYIGQVNVQIDAIKSALMAIRKYPENKKEMRQIMDFFANAILKIVSSDWILIRIVDTRNIKTLREIIKSRASIVLLKYEISNKDLINNFQNKDYISIASTQNNMTIKVFCVFSKIKLSTEQRIMLQAIANQLEMLFIIFNSKYYKR